MALCVYGFLNMSGLTSIVTLLRSPTKQVVPHTLVARTAAMRPSGMPAGTRAQVYKRDSSGVAPASPQVAYRRRGA